MVLCPGALDSWDPMKGIRILRGTPSRIRKVQGPKPPIQHCLVETKSSLTDTESIACICYQ